MKLTRLCSIRAGLYFPTKDELVRLAAQGNLIPVTRRLLPDFETPLSAYRKIRGQGESFLFESAGRAVLCPPLSVMTKHGAHGVTRPTKSATASKSSSAF